MATAYWVYGGVSQDLNDLTNWWQDTGGTIPFGGVPGGSDDAVILGSTMPTSNSGVTALNSWDSSGTATGTSIGGAVTTCSAAAYIILGVAGDNTSSHTWAGAIGSGCTLLLQGASSWDTTASFSFASLTLNDTAQVFNTSGTNTIATSGDIVCTSGTKINNGAGVVLTLSAGGDLSLTSMALGRNFYTDPFALSATGDITLDSVSYYSGVTASISGAVNVTISGSTAWSGSLTCSGNLSLAQAATGPFSVGGDMTISQTTTGPFTVSGEIIISGGSGGVSGSRIFSGF